MKLLFSQIFTLISGGGSPPATYLLTLEDASGSLLLESGDFLLLEDAP